MPIRCRFRYDHISLRRLRVSVVRGTFVYGLDGSRDFKDHIQIVLKSNHQVLPFSINAKYSNGCCRLLSSHVIRSSSFARLLRFNTPGPANLQRCKISHLRAMDWHLTTRASFSRTSFQIWTVFALICVPHKLCPLSAVAVHWFADPFFLTAAQRPIMCFPDSS